MPEDPRRSLPSVDRLARALRAGRPELPGWAAREAARRALAEAREARAGGSGGGAAPRAAGLEERARALAEALARPRPSRVVNATGVILHTNLGRAALAEEAVRAVAAAAAGYGDLELDRAGGGRGDRIEALAALLVLLSGAEGACAVNNGAAALLLALDTLARGREVIVSRGELVEIGGSFRVPEIAAKAGVRLVEVGTTNRTHRRDVEAALGPDTALLLKVHRSNFEQRGFVADVPLSALAEIGRRHGLPVVEDLGSGTLVDLRRRGLPEESYAPARLAAGADLVTFSGDKLLGGPQAGIVLGRAEPVAALRRSPLARAVRLGKLAVAGLDATLRLLAEGRLEAVPTLRMLLEPPEAVRERARALAERLRAKSDPPLCAEVVASRAPAGGGSIPGFRLESAAVALAPRAAGARRGGAADALAARLRAAPVPVLGRVAGGRVLLDVRTLLPGDEAAIEAALAPADPAPAPPPAARDD